MCALLGGEGLPDIPGARPHVVRRLAERATGSAAVPASVRRSPNSTLTGGKRHRQAGESRLVEEMCVLLTCHRELKLLQCPIKPHPEPFLKLRISTSSDEHQRCRQCDSTCRLPLTPVLPIRRRQLEHPNVKPEVADQLQYICGSTGVRQVSKSLERTNRLERTDRKHQQ